MIRTCDAEDWEYVPLERRPLGAPCGQTYDDVDHSTLCPHAPLPPKLDLEGLERLAEEHGLELPKPLRDPEPNP